MIKLAIVVGVIICFVGFVCYDIDSQKVKKCDKK